MLQPTPRPWGSTWSRDPKQQATWLPQMPGEHLDAILSAWAAMRQPGARELLAPLLADDVVWHGAAPELVCHNRREVLGMLLRNPPSGLTRFDAEEIGECVVVSIEGPGLPENDALAAGAPRTIVFTFRDGRVARMDSLRSREAALALVESQ
jgi:hypothetical protein